MIAVDKHKYMTDAKGHLVPIEGVKAQDKLENAFVIDLIEKAKCLNTALENFKQAAFADTDAFITLLAEKYGTKMGGKKGNVAFQSFDGLTKVQVSVADFIQFGPALQVAKSLIDDFIKGSAKDINADMKTIIYHAFRVDKMGQVNKASILGLRRLDITDPIWQRAMEAISDSIQVAASKRYIRFYFRPSIDKDWTAITLDLAKV